MKSYTCKKDWETDSGVYYKKGESYIGKPFNNGKSVKMRGEAGMIVNFHVGSDYFDI